MSKLRTAKKSGLPFSCENTPEAVSAGMVILGTDFRPKRRERIYDADKVWSGEHAIHDYAEI